MAVHHDPESKITTSGYSNFLVSSPFPVVTREQDPNAPECGYGAFHQQYRIDGKLVAVGVIDILPKCVSSKVGQQRFPKIGSSIAGPNFLLLFIYAVLLLGPRPRAPLLGQDFLYEGD